MKKLCIILVTLVTLSLPCFAVTVTISFDMSTADRVRAARSLESRYGRNVGETDLQLFKRSMKVWLTDMVMQDERPQPIVTIPPDPTPPDIQ